MICKILSPPPLIHLTYFYSCVFDECAGHSREDVITHSLWLCGFRLMYPREEKIIQINNLMFCLSLVFGTVVQSFLLLFWQM